MAHGFSPNPIKWPLNLFDPLLRSNESFLILLCAWPIIFPLPTDPLWWPLLLPQFYAWAAPDPQKSAGDPHGEFTFRGGGKGTLQSKNSFPPYNLLINGSGGKRGEGCPPPPQQMGLPGGRGYTNRSVLSVI